MIVQKTAQPPFRADLSSLTQEEQDNIKSTSYRSETDDYEVTFNEKYERNLLKEENKRLKAELAEPAEKAFVMERKIARFVETDDKNVLIEPEPEIEYENGIEVFRGQVIAEGGEKWIVNLNSFTTQEDWRPSVIYAQGNRTLWRKKQADIPEENLCAETPEWNSANWNDYSAGYKVKAKNAIWEATNTTHTWIEPALEGDGAISWKHVKDCN